MSKVVSNSEVMRNFLAANQAKEISNTWAMKQAAQPRIYFQEVLQSLSQLDENKLKSSFKDKYRLKRFLGHHWFLKRVALKYVGGWPHVGDIPRGWCQGSVVDFANQIIQHPNITSKSLERISSMVRIIDDILEFFPPVLVQGGEIRAEHNLLFLPFDVDDGSHRCIAAVLSGKKTISAYVGAM